MSMSNMLRAWMYVMMLEILVVQVLVTLAVLLTVGILLLSTIVMSNNLLTYDAGGYDAGVSSTYCTHTTIDTSGYMLVFIVLMQEMVVVFIVYINMISCYNT